MTGGWLVAKQKPKLSSQKAFLLYVEKQIWIPNLKQLVMLGYSISQVTWIKIFCVSQRPSHWSRKETPWVRSHRCSTDPCVPSPPGLEGIITHFASFQIQPCDRLVDAQSISQGLKKMAVSNTFRILFWTPRRVWGNPVFVYKKWQVLQLNLNNLKPELFFQKAFLLLEKRFEFQTWSNLWCLDISQVTWIKIFCVSKRPSHWSRKETPRVRSHRCSSDPCVPSPPGLEGIITNFASSQTQPSDRLVHAQSISQGLKKMAVSNTFRILFWTPRRVWGNPVFVYKYATAAAQSQITISNLEVRELTGRTAWQILADQK